MLVTGVLLAGADDQLVDDVAHDRVEAGGRLVVEQHFGVHGQRPGQADALPHAAGKLGRRLAEHAVGQPDLRQAARRRSASIFSAACWLILSQRKRDVLGDGHAVEQRGVLKHEAEAAAQRGELLVVEFVDPLAVENDVAARWDAAGR